MDEALIAAWNEVIRPDDTVYHLADFAYRAAHDPGAYLSRLDGRVILVAGNHDSPAVREMFVESHDIANIRIGRKLLVLCRYAMRTWMGSHRGSLHCYAHSHGTLPPLGRSMDVGVDTNGFYPYRIEDVVQRLSALPMLGPGEQR